MLREYKFMQNYDLLVEKISRAAGLAKEEFERKIEAKKAKLSGLISKEGAAQIVAAELGINFENEMFKISELIPGMKRINLVGKIITMFPVREFNKNGREGKVLNFIIADETGSIRAVLWDTNHIALIEKGEMKTGDVVEIRNATMRESEIHLTSFSEIKKSSVVIENVKTERNFSDKTIEESKEGQSVKVRGVVVQFFPPRFFHVCPECGKKATQTAEGFECAAHGKVQAKERAILNLVIDDGTESIRVVLFSEQINKIVKEEDLKDVEKVAVFREDILGTELMVSGSVKKNQLFGNLEMSVSDIQRVDVEQVISELEKN
jgi:replication factor A1